MKYPHREMMTMKYDKSINDGDNRNDSKTDPSPDLTESEIDLYDDLLEEQLETM